MCGCGLLWELGPGPNGCLGESSVGILCLEGVCTAPAAARPSPSDPLLCTLTFMSPKRHAVCFSLIELRLGLQRMIILVIDVCAKSLFCLIKFIL